MTWDFYFMNRFFREWQNKGDTNEFLIASNDNVLREVLRVTIEIQKSGKDYMDHILVRYPDWQIYFQQIEELKYTKRAYKGEDWNPEYRSKLIEDYEKKLL